MIVTRRRYNTLKDNRDFEQLRADVNIMLWLEQSKELKGLTKELSITDQSLASAESALEEKERIIERLQDDLYQMHDHMMYVRNVMANLP